jgi:hypothetical protein
MNTFLDVLESRRLLAATIVQGQPGLLADSDGSQIEGKCNR